MITKSIWIKFPMLILKWKCNRLPDRGAQRHHTLPEIASYQQSLRLLWRGMRKTTLSFLLRTSYLTLHVFPKCQKYHHHKHFTTALSQDQEVWWAKWIIQLILLAQRPILTSSCTRRTLSKSIRIASQSKRTYSTRSWPRRENRRPKEKKIGN